MGRREIWYAGWLGFGGKDRMKNNAEGWDGKGGNTERQIVH